MVYTKNQKTLHGVIRCASVPLYSGRSKQNDVTSERGFRVKKITGGVAFTNEFVHELDVWIHFKHVLKEAKEKEADTRHTICTHMFGDYIGEFRVVDSGKGFKVNAVSKVNISVDEALLTALNKEEEFTPDEAACFDWKIKIKESNLKKLPKTSRVWKAITTKPAMPTLEVERCDDQ